MPFCAVKKRYSSILGGLGQKAKGSKDIEVWLEGVMLGKAFADQV
jgi:hypothetical protein